MRSVRRQQLLILRLPCRRLDADRLAVHDGGCGPERLRSQRRRSLPRSVIIVASSCRRLMIILSFRRIRVDNRSMLSRFGFIAALFVAALPVFADAPMTRLKVEVLTLRRKPCRPRVGNCRFRRRPLGHQTRQRRSSSTGKSVPIRKASRNSCSAAGKNADSGDRQRLSDVRPNV